MRTFQFKIQLKYFDSPPVWRRVLVPEDFTFDEFHGVIQVIFLWDNCHMYQFSKKGWGSVPRIISSEYEEEDTLDSSEVKLSDIFTHSRQTYTYIYDFGDDWTHDIKLEKILPDAIEIPVCTGGEGACPPEDCGGIPGYYRMVEILGDKKHPEHAEMKEWLGLGKKDTWDVNAFDLDEVNDYLDQVFTAYKADGVSGSDPQ